MFQFCKLLLFIISFISSCTGKQYNDTNQNNSTTSTEESKFKVPNLMDYLRSFTVDPAVLMYANIGVENYKKEPLLSRRKSALANNTTGGDRTGSWIAETFGLTSEQIRNRFADISVPPAWTIEHINTVYDQETLKVPRGPKKNVEFVVVFGPNNGLSANYIQNSALGRDSVQQLASQFNYLESPGENLFPVDDYVGDWTQGPQVAIEAAAATLHRDQAVRAGRLPHALAKVLPEDNSSYYRNGYLQLWKAPQLDAEILAAVQKNISQLQIVAQWAKCEPSASIQLVVPSAAPSYQGSARPTINSTQGQISNLLVSVQYEAIGKLAVLRSIASGMPTPVHVTLVGQGAFKNPREIMKSAFKGLAEAVSGYDKVKVYVHTYDLGAKNLFEEQIGGLLNVSSVTMTREDFLNAQPLS